MAASARNRAGMINETALGSVEGLAAMGRSYKSGARRRRGEASAGRDGGGARQARGETAAGRGKSGARRRRGETRVKRIETACDKLAAGRRRACCFDRSGMYSKGNMGAPEAAE